MTRPIRDHVCLSSIDWGYLWQGPQEVMTRLAQEGSRVLYVEHMGVRRPYVADWQRVLGRIRQWLDHPAGRVVGPGHERIVVISPIILPFPWSRIARAVNRRLFADRLPETARRFGFRELVVWTFVPTPVAVDTVRAFKSRGACAAYYCVADFEQVADRPDRMRRSEDEMLREVDIVFAGGRVLERRLAARHRRVVLAPFSVGDTFFGPPISPPPDLAAIPHPRVGYVGGLHRHVNTELLDAVVRALPDVNFVFIGPKVSGDWAVESAPNAHFLGRRLYEELPAYIDGFDACFIPYRTSPFTESAWPTKLHEYLARGRPTVSTPIREVLLLEYEPAALRIAATVEEIGRALRAAIADAPNRIELRRALAEGYSWSRTLRRMLSEIEQCAEGRR